MRKVNHENNLGFLFEDYFALVKLKMPKEFLSELVAHSDKGADIIWKDKIYSLKFRIDSQHKTLTFRQDKDCRPEYLEALKRESPFIFVFLNPKWSDKIMRREINPATDGNLIVCKPNQIIVEKATKNFVI